MIYSGQAGQIFTMEYPGRLVDMETYKYKYSKGINAQQTKPQTVAEAEFRLSEDLFNLGTIISWSWRLLLLTLL